MRCTLIWLLLCILCCAVLTSAQPPAETLAPFDYLNGQLIDLDTGVKLYKIADLKPSTAYEVRLSFPASIPAAVTYRVVEPPAPPPTALSAPAAASRRVSLLNRIGRRLLDTEKFEFVTGSQGEVQGIAEPHLELRAFRRSVHREGPKAGVKKLVYNIVLAELVYGVPKDSIPTVATIVLVVVVAFLWSLVWSTRLFPAFLDFLTNTSSSSSSSSGGGGGDSSGIGSSSAAAADGTSVSPPGATASASRKAVSRGHNKRSS